jgi:branched-chain amino acid transport system substrate-binding protein
VSFVRKVFAVALLAALAWAVAPVAEGQKPIRIGATLAQTGGYAFHGQIQLRGYRLCVKHMNERGGVLGRKLELLVHDDGSDPATAVRLYEKLITRDKVDLVLGPFGGAIVDPVANVIEKHRIPMVAPVAGPTFIYKKGRKFIFSMAAPGEILLEGLIDLAAKKGLKTVALIYEDDLGGTWFDDTDAMRAAATTAEYERTRAAAPDFLAGDVPFIITEEIHVLRSPT